MIAEKILDTYKSRFGTTDDDGNKTVFTLNGDRYIILGNHEYNVDKVSEKRGSEIINMINNW